MREEFSGGTEVALVGGDPDVSVGPYYRGDGAGIAIDRDRSFQYYAEGVLIGFFGLGTGSHTASITNGDGVSYSCSTGCHFFSISSGIVLRGTVTFQVTQSAAASACVNCPNSGAEIVLWGMEARLPTL